MAFRKAGTPLVHRVRRWPRRVLVTIAVIVVVLVAARIALPYVVKDQINKRLASVPGYSGAVNDVGIGILRGAYSINGINIVKVEGESRVPFFAAEHIDFSLAWRELVRGKIVSEIYADRPELNIVQASTDESSQKDVDSRWKDVIKDLFPIDITFFEIRDGLVRYQDTTKAPHVDVFIKDMHVLATGLRNRPAEGDEGFPAEIQVEGNSLGGGKVSMMLAADPLAPQPHFHLRMKVDGVNLPDLNESLKAVANVDVGRGTFRMAAEMAGKDGGFQGYVKPFFEDLDFNNLEDKNKKVLTRIWENIVGGLAWLVKNKARDQVGTRIPFQGQFGDPQVGLMSTIRNLFRHGFVRAFNPTIEGSVRPENVLPSGASADGKSVADAKADGGADTKTGIKQGAGAPTGRNAQPSPTPPKR
jgi:hypothetical protein